MGRWQPAREHKQSGARALVGYDCSLEDNITGEHLSMNIRFKRIQSGDISQSVI